MTPPPAIATYLILVTLVAAVLVLLTGRLSPRNPSSAKARPYESGVSEPFSALTRWPVRYALLGMLFLVFDVEALFLYPWATVLRQLGWLGLLAVITFFAVLGVGYLYVRARGALEWR
jgi:NADH-quinone oxidoreductase subunit A